MQEVGADAMLTTYTEPEVMSYFPGGLHGVDRDGHAVLVERMGNMYVNHASSSPGSRRVCFLARD